MFNVSIREYFPVLYAFIVCIRNTARSKSNPLLCTHVDSYMLTTPHPPGFANHQIDNWNCPKFMHKFKFTYILVTIET